MQKLARRSLRSDASGAVDLLEQLAATAEALVLLAEARGNARESHRSSRGWVYAQDVAVSDFARGRIGTVLSDKWRLDELLGWGGMAAVYAGTHTRNRSRVAVKLLHPELGREPALRTRFLREGYVANSIDHPGIVRVFDDAAEGDSVYLVMELLKGKSDGENEPEKSGRCRTREALW